MLVLLLVLLMSVIKPLQDWVCKIKLKFQYFTIEIFSTLLILQYFVLNCTIKDSVVMYYVLFQNISGAASLIKLS